MAKMLFVLMHGHEDPTRAGPAFFLATDAVEAGHRPTIVQAGDGAVLARRSVAAEVRPVGIPPLLELVDFAVENEIQVPT